MLSVFPDVVTYTTARSSTNLSGDVCLMMKNKARQYFYTNLLTENFKLGCSIIITFLINLAEGQQTKGERITHNKRREKKASSKSN